MGLEEEGNRGCRRISSSIDGLDLGLGACDSVEKIVPNLGLNLDFLVLNLTVNSLASS